MSTRYLGWVLWFIFLGILFAGTAAIYWNRRQVPESITMGLASLLAGLGAFYILREGERG